MAVQAEHDVAAGYGRRGRRRPKRRSETPHVAALPKFQTDAGVLDDRRARSQPGAVAIRRLTYRYTLGVSTACREVVESRAFVWSEGVDRLGVLQHQRARRQRAGLVEYDAADRTGPVEEPGAANEQPATSQPRLRHLVRERRGDTESARTRDDEDGGRHTHCAPDVVGRQPPSGEGHGRDQNDSRDVDLRQRLPPGRGPGGLAFRALRLTEEFTKTGGGEGGDHAEGRRPTSRREGARRHDVPGGVGPWSTLPVNPVQRKGCRVSLEARVGRHQVARRDEQNVSLENLAARNHRDASVGHAAREQAFGAVAVEKPGPIAFEHALLKPAPEEHQRDEYVERIEVGISRPLRPVRMNGPGKGERDSEGDG